MTTSASDRLRAVCATLLACVLLATSASAWAEPSAKDREAARNLLISGREKKKNGDLNGAIGDFYRAHGIMHVPTTGLDLGKAQAEVGLLVEARTTLLETAKLPVKPNEAPAFARAREEAKRLAEQITARLATVTVNIKGLPPRAKVILSVDGADNSSAVRGQPFKINPGKRTIGASHGESTASKPVDIPEGGSQTIELTLVPRPGEPAAAGEVDLDAAPADPNAKPPPKTDVSSEEALAEASTSGDAAKPKPTATSTNPLVFVGIATTGLGVAVGTVTGLMSMSIYSSVEPRCTRGLCPPETHSDIDNGVTLATASTVSFVVAGIGAGITVWGLLTPRKVPAKAATSFRVLPLPNGVVGTF